MEKSYIGAYIQHYRKKRNMTQSELAQGYCVRQTLSKIEKGMERIAWSDYLALLDHLHLTYLDIDRTILYQHLETLYQAYLNDQDLRPHFQTLYTHLHLEDILHQEYHAALQVLYTYYIDHKSIHIDIQETLLSQRNMYPFPLRYLINHMVYQLQSIYLSDRKLEKYALKHTLFTPQEPLSIRNQIPLLISLKRYLEAYEITQELYTHTTHYTLQLEALRYTLVLYDLIQPVFSYTPIHRIEEFLLTHRNDLTSKQICDTYYQIGTILLNNHDYPYAYTCFKNCHEVSPSLLSTVILMNYIALHKNTQLPFITLPTHTLKTHSLYTTLYQYFAYKQRLLTAKVNTLLLYNGLETYLMNHILDLSIQDRLLQSIIQEEIRVVYHHTKNSKLLPVLG